jgi:nucleoside 2-deoxyribosyltransferase
MKVYIAAPWSWKNLAKEWALILDSMGHEITSRWLALPDVEPATRDILREQALMDLADIDRSDALFLMTGYTGGNAHTGGRHFETGYAFAKGKRIVVCPSTESVFHYLPGIERITVPEEFK